MAKKPAAPADPDALVRTALLAVANATEDVKLAGKDGGLFAGKTAATKATIDRLLNPERPLLRVVRKEKTTEFVTLTPAGFLDVAGEIPEEKVSAAARRIVEGLPPDGVVPFLQEFLPNAPTAAPELEPLLAEAVRKQKAEVDARIDAERKRAERLEASRAAFQKCLDHLARLRSGRIDELTRLLQAAGGTVPQPGSLSPPVVLPTVSQPVGDCPLPAPATEEEVGFRRQVARRLISSWIQQSRAGRDEGRQAMETALGGLPGLRRVGAVGDRVRFEGAMHESERSVSEGAEVRIIRPGWTLMEELGPLTLQKVLVEA